MLKLYIKFIAYKKNKGIGGRERCLMEATLSLREQPSLSPLFVTTLIFSSPFFFFIGSFLPLGTFL